MGGRIEPIRKIEYNATRVQPVHGYTVEEYSKKLAEVEQLLADREEVRKYLALYPNPEHLGFKELLDREIHNYGYEDYSKGYILDIGHHDQESDSGVYHR